MLKTSKQNRLVVIVVILGVILWRLLLETIWVLAIHLLERNIRLVASHHLRVEVCCLLLLLFYCPWEQMLMSIGVELVVEVVLHRDIVIVLVDVILLFFFSSALG